MALRVLMVTGEADLLALVSRRIAHERTETTFEGFADPLEALARLRDAAPDLLVVDTPIPSMSGTELFSAVRSVAAGLRVVLFLSSPDQDLETAIRGDANAEVIRGPCAVEPLLAAIDRVAASRYSPMEGFSGRIRLPMLPDLIQVVALSRESVCLTVRERGGAEAEAGLIWFQEGEIVHAVHRGLSGPDAFFSLLALKGGRFSAVPCERAPERTIGARWEELVMEGFQRVDESSRKAGDGFPAAAFEEVFPPEELRLLRQSIPSGERGLSVVAYRLSTGAAAIVAGDREVDLEALGSALAGLAETVGRLSAEPEGILEEVRDGAALAVSWCWPEDRVVLMAQRLESAFSVTRFRARVTAIHRAITPPARAGASDAGVES